MNPSLEATYQKHADNGLTIPQTAERLGVTRQAVFLAARRHGIKFRLEADVRRSTVNAPMPKNIHALVAALADKRGVAFDFLLADLVTAGARGQL